MYNKSSIQSSCSNPWHYLIAIWAMVRKGSMPKARNRIRYIFKCRLATPSIAAECLTCPWCQLLMSKLCSTMRLQSHPGFSRERIKRARKQMPWVQRTCFRFWPLWMSHAASYPSCRIFILILVVLLSDYTIVYVYAYIYYTYV